MGSVHRGADQVVHCRIDDQEIPILAVLHVDGGGNKKARIAGDQPTYVSYDIDFVDPTFAPGTGTPEVGGPNSFQALQVVRELARVNIIGADMVEVSPPFDASGGTAFLGVSIMFEMLCIMADRIAET